MGVDLGRGDIGVAEQRLQHAQVGAARQQMGGEGMAQDVRADAVGRDPGIAPPFPGPIGTGAPGSNDPCRWGTATRLPRHMRQPSLDRRLGPR